MSFSSSVIAGLRSGEDANIIQRVDTHLTRQLLSGISKMDSPASEAKAEEDQEIDKVWNGGQLSFGAGGNVAEEEEWHEGHARE